jgi:hypothetical protein
MYAVYTKDECAVEVQKQQFLLWNSISKLQALVCLSPTLTFEQPHEIWYKFQAFGGLLTLIILNININ